MRSSRPRRVLPAALFAALLLLTTACGGRDAGAAAGDAPVRGGTLTFAVHADTDCLDPQLTGNSVGGWIARNALDSLVAQAPDSTITPWLAQRWEISPDGKTYTFTLRPGVTFTDGTPLDASAVKANLDRITDPATKSSYGRSLLGPLTGTEAVDPQTVRLTLSAPFAPLLQGLSLPFLGIESPTWFTGNPNTCSGLVGSGPFVLSSYTRGQGASFTRNEAYAWGPGYATHTGAAHLDRLEIKIVTENSVRTGGLRSGQFDGIANVPPLDLAALQGDPSLRVLKNPNPGVNFVLLLNTARAPFDDLAVRAAFQSAVDWRAVVASVFRGQAEPADSLFGPTTKYYDKSAAGLWGFDVARANQLLDGAGWTARDAEGFRTRGGTRLTAQLIYSDTSASAEEQTLFEAAAQQVKPIGFDLRLEKVASAAYQDRGGSGDYDVAALYFVRAEPDIARTVFSSAFIPPKGANYSRVQDPELEAALTRGRELPDGPDREQAYAAVQQRVLTQAYAVPTYVPFGRVGLRADVGGFAFATNSGPLFYDAWKGPGT